jgi:hypothetical protein
MSVIFPAVVVSQEFQVTLSPQVISRVQHLFLLEEIYLLLELFLSPSESQGKIGTCLAARCCDST